MSAGRRPERAEGGEVVEGREGSSAVDVVAGEDGAGEETAEGR
jgi:hypothetical protein